MNLAIQWRTLKSYRVYRKDYTERLKTTKTGRSSVTVISQPRGLSNQNFVRERRNRDVRLSGPPWNALGLGAID